MSQESILSAPSVWDIVPRIWNQFWTERSLAERGILFRTADEQKACSAYAAMTEEEFRRVNGRQAWASWRTIRKCFQQCRFNEPITAIDLGCGSGDSTRALAFYCPYGSRIIGYELAEPLARIAERRRYQTSCGRRADVSFVCQGITQALLSPVGEPLAVGSVNIASACGVVGHHLTPQTVIPLLEELSRVLSPSGCAFLDVGPTLSDSELTCLMTRFNFKRVARCRSLLFDPYGQVIFARKLIR